jgi:hypothetical protein
MLGAYCIMDITTVSLFYRPTITKAYLQFVYLRILTALDSQKPLDSAGTGDPFFILILVWCTFLSAVLLNISHLNILGMQADTVFVYQLRLQKEVHILCLNFFLSFICTGCGRKNSTIWGANTNQTKQDTIF